MNNRYIVLILNVSHLLSASFNKKGFKIISYDLDIPKDAFCIGEYYCHESQNFCIKIAHSSFDEVVAGVYPKKYLASIVANVD